MESRIGTHAGKIWHYLAKHPGLTVKSLAKGVDLKKEETDLALGWLAREGKLVFTTDKKGNLTLSLKG